MRSLALCAVLLLGSAGSAAGATTTLGVTVQVIGPASVTVADSPYQEGTAYTIRITNSQRTAFTAVRVRVAPATYVVSSKPSGQFVRTAGGTVLQVALGTLRAHRTAAIRIVIQFPARLKGQRYRLVTTVLSGARKIGASTTGVRLD